jgi:hypothetical protein
MSDLFEELNVILNITWWLQVRQRLSVSKGAVRKFEMENDLIPAK